MRFPEVATDLRRRRPPVDMLNGKRLLRGLAMAFLALAASACGGASPSAPSQPAATSFEEYSVAFCASFDSMFRAVGNPDTGSGSVLSKSLDEAVAAGDAVSAERLAANIRTELATGRQQAAVAGGWQPAKAVAAQLDRVLAAFEAMIEAKRLTAKHSATVDPQTAFEQAGGVDAWTAMFEAYRTVPRPSGSAQTQCPNVPVSP